MERVDVVEIEPAILDVARQCKDVNAGAMDNPKMHAFIGDAREVLLASKRTYDIIMSEPSNPYRAGISSLFTREFYQAVKQRMAPGGIFIQWLQGYEIDAPTMKSVYATLTSEFGSVETWQTVGSDLLLIATEAPMTHDVARLRERIQQEPYREGLAKTWYTNEAEGFLAHFIGGPELARRLAAGNEHLINTDDLSFMEFAIARTMGRQGRLETAELREGAYMLNAQRPTVTGGTVDWEREYLMRFYGMLMRHSTPEEVKARSQAYNQRALFNQAFTQEDYASIVRAWRKTPWQPQGVHELMGLGQALASAGDEASLPMAEQLRPLLPLDADVIVAMLRLRQGRLTEATEALEQAYTRLRTEPWGTSRSGKLLFQTTTAIAAKEPALGRRLFAAIEKPFSTYAFEPLRLTNVLEVAQAVGWAELCQRAIKPREPHIRWNLDYLQARYACYEANRDPLREQALTDLSTFLAEEPARLLSDRSLFGEAPPLQQDSAPSVAEEQP
jgi:hypothetical protein